MSGLLEYEEDRFGGVLFKETAFTLSLNEFQERLKTSLLKLNDQRHALWFEVPKRFFRFIPHLSESGFEQYSGTAEKSVFVIRNQANLPEPITSIAGASSIILREHDSQTQVLLIEQNTRRDRLFPDFPTLKAPGGAVDRGEFLVQAALREVKEEVGLDVEFVRLLGVGNRIRANASGINDYLFFCLAKLINPHQEVKIQESELRSAQWYPIKDIVDKTQEQLMETLRVRLADVSMHILNHHFGSRSTPNPMIQLLDVRQKEKVDSEKDLSDVMNLHLMPRVGEAES